ncbi:MAG TPA: 4Fe-4S dicluster domain-containing protein [Spirochaetes bacterium]|nr:4Fe-4S dicluster domain-containing protein [Spirochaetota bacterium]
MSRRPEWWLTVLAKIWPLTWISARLTTAPVIGKLVAALALPLFSKKNLNISYLPINLELSAPGSTPLPVAIVEELIRRSSHRVIIKRCTCRDAKQCENHPIDYGCTLLGEGTREIDPRIARHVTVEEAIAHLHATVEDGLIPMTGRVKIDNFIWGVRDRGRLLTICHCCRCCCTILASGKYLPREAADSIVRLRGLSITVDPSACMGCGLCVDECFMGALSLESGAIAHDHDICKGCGRCVEVCPEKAISIHLEDTGTAVDELLSRIRERINYE